MSQKPQPDTSRIVKNQLLSAATYALDDFTQNAILLPAAPPPAPPIVSEPKETLDQLKSSVFSGAPVIHDTETFSEISLDQTSDTDASYPSPTESQHAHESAGNSLLEQLPNVASSVFASFSNILRGPTDPQHHHTSSAATQHQQSTQEYSSTLYNYQIPQPFLSATVPTPSSPPLPIQPPPIPEIPEPAVTPTFYTPDEAKFITPIASVPAAPSKGLGNAYRLSSKKKTYAPLPGLNSGASAPTPPLNPNTYIPQAQQPLQSTEPPHQDHITQTKTESGGTFSFSSILSAAPKLFQITGSGSTAGHPQPQQPIQSTYNPFDNSTTTQFDLATSHTRTPTPGTLSNLPVTGNFTQENTFYTPSATNYFIPSEIKVQSDVTPQLIAQPTIVIPTNATQSNVTNYYLPNDPAQLLPPKTQEIASDISQAAYLNPSVQTSTKELTNVPLEQTLPSSQTYYFQNPSEQVSTAATAFSELPTTSPIPTNYFVPSISPSTQNVSAGYFIPSVESSQITTQNFVPPSAPFIPSTSPATFTPTSISPSNQSINFGIGQVPTANQLHSINQVGASPPPPPFAATGPPSGGSQTSNYRLKGKPHYKNPLGISCTPAAKLSDQPLQSGLFPTNVHIFNPSHETPQFQPDNIVHQRQNIFAAASAPESTSIISTEQSTAQNSTVIPPFGNYSTGQNQATDNSVSNILSPEQPVIPNAFLAEPFVANQPPIIQPTIPANLSSHALETHTSNPTIESNSVLLISSATDPIEDTSALDLNLNPVVADIQVVDPFTSIAPTETHLANTNPTINLIEVTEPIVESAVVQSLDTNANIEQENVSSEKQIPSDAIATVIDPIDLSVPSVVVPASSNQIQFPKYFSASSFFDQTSSSSNFFVPSNPSNQSSTHSTNLTADIFASNQPQPAKLFPSEDSSTLNETTNLTSFFSGSLSSESSVPKENHPQKLFPDIFESPTTNSSIVPQNIDTEVNVIESSTPNAPSDGGSNIKTFFAEIPPAEPTPAPVPASNTFSTSVVDSPESTSQSDYQIQNFFNNPPPLAENRTEQELFQKSTDVINKRLQQKSLSGGIGGGGSIETESISFSSNFVEPPSSAQSEFSEIIDPTNVSDQFSVNNVLKQDLLNCPELNMATENAETTNIVYRPVYYHWFYKKTSTEIKQMWTPFSMIDSMNLERATADEIVTTDGGRYDVNKGDRLRSPVYWEGEPDEVRRCSWFFKGNDSKLCPYDESIADKLEDLYKEASNSGDWHRKLPLPNGETVVFHSPSVIVHFLANDSPDNWPNSTLPQASQRPRVVKRGVDEFNIEEGEAEQIDHLMFMVHGIGSVCDLKFRPLEEVVDDFRNISLQLIQSHYRSSCDRGRVGRIEILPISWHSQLHSGDSGIDERLKQISLESIPKLRAFTNDTLLDILFYTSPIFCQQIMETVTSSLNEIYELFRQRNPRFRGSVSLAGHSLGSLILFDLLQHQKTPRKYSMASGRIHLHHRPSIAPSLATIESKQVNYAVGKAGTGQAYINYPQLDFRTKKFFALGSPIGMFVTVRGIDSLGLDYKLPTTEGFYNIFHPYDPVAYRIEALVNPELATLRPVLIEHHKGRKRMHIELRETMARVGADIKNKLVETYKTTLSTVYSFGMLRSDPKELQKEVDKVLDEQLKLEGVQELASSSASSEIDTGETDIPLGVLNQGKRIDYVLQEAPLESFNEYLFAMTSHVCYWESEDTCLFIIKEIYSSLGIQSDNQIPQQSMTIERPVSASSNGRM